MTAKKSLPLARITMNSQGTPRTENFSLLIYYPDIRYPVPYDVRLRMQFRAFSRFNIMTVFIKTSE
ncbi:MAG: hypothetical protein WAU31_04175 [Candidatus Moraniibacteriota bacterium]